MVLLVSQLRQWIFVSTNFIIISADVVSFQHYDIYSGWGKISTSVTVGESNEIGIDRSLCITKCRGPHCVAVSYNHTTKHCGFMYNTWTNIVPGVNVDFIIVRDINVSTVLLGEAPSTLGQSGQWSETDANDACVEVGQHLITRAQLEVVLDSDGYVFCGCGIVSGGNEWKPVGAQNGDCGLGRGLHPCHGATYAFCTTI